MEQPKRMPSGKSCEFNLSSASGGKQDLELPRGLVIAAWEGCVEEAEKWLKGYLTR